MHIPPMQNIYKNAQSIVFNEHVESTRVLLFERIRWSWYNRFFFIWISWKRSASANSSTPIKAQS